MAEATLQITGIQPASRKQPEPAAFFGQLRPDVNLYPSVPLADGSPTWVLHDQVGNRFLEIGWLEFEIISRWPLNSARAIVAAVNRETALTIDDTDIKRTGLFLDSQQLLLNDVKTLLHKQQVASQQKQGNLLKFLVSHYLFFRIPLVWPDTFLSNTMWLVRPIFTAAFRWLCQHAVEYGFILRYPKEAEAVTEITYEPWHWRYVGPENAALISQSGLCFEDAIAVLQKLAAGQSVTG